MNIYEWQPLDDETSSNDGGRASLNLSGHFSGESTSDSHSHLSDDGSCEDSTSPLQLHAKLTDLRVRLEENGERYATVKNLSRLRRHIEKELAAVEDLLRERSQEDGDDLLRRIAAHRVHLHYLETLVMTLENEVEVTKVCASFRITSGDKRETVPVDLVSCGGLRWVKVRVASTWGLRKEMRKVGWEAPISRLVVAAKGSKLPFMQLPEVVVLFSCGFPESMGETIRRLGARPVSLTQLRLRGVGGPFQAQWGSGDFLPPRVLSPKFICFDTTALVALCSEACFAKSVAANVEALRGFSVLAEQQRREESDLCVRTHIEPVLTQHTRWLHACDMKEALQGRIRSSSRGAVADPSVCGIDLSWLERLIDPTAEVDISCEPLAESTVVRQIHKEMTHQKGSSESCSRPNWIVADVTLSEFRWILETIAGPRELRRALSLLRCCSVVSTSRQYVEARDPLITHVSHLASSSKVSQRNLFVFGLGDALEAVVLSSNRQIPNVALNEGVELMVAAHPARALIEQKVRGMPRREGPPTPPPVGASSAL